MIASMIRVAVLAFIVALALPQMAQAQTHVQQIKTPGGIEAWLVHETSVPMIAINFGFKGGASQDPVGKDGLTKFMSGLLDEGAGPYNSRSFQEKLQAMAIALQFGVDRDVITGSLTTLSANRDAAFELLRLSLNEPRFDKDAVERVRNQIFAIQRQQDTEADNLAAQAFSENAFPNHPYGRRVLGTETSVKDMSREDIVEMHKKLFARDNLKITVVGDIEVAELSIALDKIFGALPAKAQLADVPEIKLGGQGRQIVVDAGGMQSQIQFGQVGPKRHDADFMPTYLLNHMLGGSAFSSRLYKEIREKRGLTYGVYTDLATLDHAGAFVGTMSTKNASAGEALGLVRSEIAAFVKDGPTDDELAQTKTFLIGSYPLRFDTTGKIASLLLGLQLDDFTPDYLTEREGLINAVTKDDIKKAAQKMLSDPLLVVVAGQPKGIEAK